jgi:hypothetical protein
MTKGCENNDTYSNMFVCKQTLKYYDIKSSVAFQETSREGLKLHCKEPPVSDPLKKYRRIW